MKVLVSAYACEPDKGSEPGVGWNWAKTISAKHDVWVLTKANNKASIERELSQRPITGVHFEYVDIPRFLSFWKKGQRGVRTYYYIWQFFALARAIKLNREIRFDLGHHVSFVNDYVFTFLSLMPVPFIWGPIGSNAKIPFQLIKSSKARAALRLRLLVQGFLRWIDPLYWMSVLRAKKILVINRDVANLGPLRWLGKGKTLIESAIGIENLQSVDDQTREPKTVLNILYVGRLLPIKGAHLAFDGFSRIIGAIPSACLTFIGYGPLKSAIEKTARDLGLSDNVRVLSWMSRREVLSAMDRADIFLFPSMEGSGMVVLEALAMGKPVVCLDFGGPGQFVNADCGIKICVGDYETVTKDLGSALVRLARDEGIRQRLADGARVHASSFHWSHKLDIIDALYKEVVGISNQSQEYSNA
jgi:glycosyltransferase involved in cell wall biosynthesis